MVMHDFYTPGPDAHPLVNPWFVVTKAGVVADRFDASQGLAAQACARRLGSGGDPTVHLYVVDSQVVPSPTTGDLIDAESAGWVLMQ
ncbi:MAG TPA: hypothetical protein VHX44_10915 [Planctomycetota bacterium]|nr:hypothetical protein [Planctomycetota bacterium]